MLRRTLTLLAAAASVAGAAPATAAAPPAAPDHLVVTVRHSGRATDGTFALACHPAGGRHPQPAAACAAVTRASRGARDPFAPVPGDAVCTMIYGGPATARVTGTWHGRPVAASFDRSNGCELSRWDALVPLLPDVG
jgi:subtilisin inhibitor-like